MDFPTDATIRHRSKGQPLVPSLSLSTGRTLKISPPQTMSSYRLTKKTDVWRGRSNLFVLAQGGMPEWLITCWSPRPCSQAEDADRIQQGEPCLQGLLAGLGAFPVDLKWKPFGFQHLRVRTDRHVLRYAKLHANLNTEALSHAVRPRRVPAAVRVLGDPWDHLQLWMDLRES